MRESDLAEVESLFEEDQSPATEDREALVLNLDGFEGPIDLLLTLAREHKVDLTKIPILALAEQYLSFIQQARRLQLELAADYLVMAAWLAYLKSRLLLPKPEVDDDEPTGEEMAAALQFQLQRLEAMRDSGRKLFAGDLLGREVFARGQPEGFGTITHARYTLSLFELLQGYGAIQRRGKVETLHIAPPELYSMDDALARLNRSLGAIADWTTLSNFMPEGLDNSLLRRSAMASMLTASLELARSGSLSMRQDRVFGPIYVRRRTPEVGLTSVGEK